MNQLHIGSVAFPISDGTLSTGLDESGVRYWNIEIQCEESTQQLDDHDELDWVTDTEPCLYAQLLPIPADSPEELLGKTFSFPQTPEDDPAEWDRGDGWLFFCLYLLEHELAYPMGITFVERQKDRIRVRIVGNVSLDSVNHEIRADAWLDWIAE